MKIKNDLSWKKSFLLGCHVNGGQAEKRTKKSYHRVKIVALLRKYSNSLVNASIPVFYRLFQDNY